MLIRPHKGPLDKIAWHGRSARGALDMTTVEHLPVQCELVQLRLAKAAGHLVELCRATGKRPNRYLRLWHINGMWRYHLRRVKGQAGDALRALNEIAKKKDKPRTPEQLAATAYESALFEFAWARHKELVANGMDGNEAAEVATAERKAKMELHATLADIAADIIRRDAGVDAAALKRQLDEVFAPLTAPPAAAPVAAPLDDPLDDPNIPS